MGKVITNFKNEIQLLLISLFTWLVISCGAGVGGGTTTPYIPHTTYPLNDLILQDINANSFTLSWDLHSGEGGAMDGSIKYYVRVKNATNAVVANIFYTTKNDFIQNTDLLQMNPLKTKAVNVAVTNLNVGETYTIEISVLDQIDNKEIKSAIMKVVTTGNAMTPAAVSLLGQVIQTNNDQIYLSWSQVSDAQSYIVVIAEDVKNLFGPVQTEKFFAVVCPPEKSTLCSTENVAITNINNNRLGYFVKGLTTGKKYGLVVVPLNFRDFVGMKSVDKDGNVVSYEDSVINLVRNKMSETVDQMGNIELKKSGARQRVENTLADTASIREIEIKRITADAVSGITVKTSGTRVYLSWNHAPGANGYGLILKTNGVQVRSNFISDRYASQYAGIGYHVFNNLVNNTEYSGVILSFLDNVAGGSNTFTATTTTNSISAASAIADFTLTNSSAGIMDVSWTNEGDSILAYNVYYHKGTSIPSGQKPKYVANPNNNERSVRFNVDPGEYSVRVDIVDAFGIHMGTTKKVKVYSYPVAPKDLSVDFLNAESVKGLPGSGNLYRDMFPITYSKATTTGDAGGYISNAHYYTRYRNPNSDWTPFITNAFITNTILTNIFGDVFNETYVLVDDINNFGKIVEVELMVSNDGGYTATTRKSFVLKSFPFPVFNGQTLSAESNRLNISWAPANRLNGSALDHYLLMVSAPTGEQVIDSYFPIMITNVLLSPDTTSFSVEVPLNNSIYFVRVLPVGKSTGSLLDMLSDFFGYDPYDRSTYVKDCDAPFIYLCDKLPTEAFIASLAYHIGDEIERVAVPVTGNPDPVTGLKAVTTDNTNITVSWIPPATLFYGNEFEIQRLALDSTNATNFRGKTGTNTMAFVDEYTNLNWPSLKQYTSDTNLIVKGVDTTNQLQIIRVKVKQKFVKDAKESVYSDYVYYAIGSTDSTANGLSFSRPHGWGDTIPSEFGLPFSSGTDSGGRRNSLPITGKTDDSD